MIASKKEIQMNLTQLKKNVNIIKMNILNIN